MFIKRAFLGQDLYKKGRGIILGGKDRRIRPVSNCKVYRNGSISAEELDPFPIVKYTETGLYRQGNRRIGSIGPTIECW